VLDRVQSTCSIQHPSFCKIPCPPFPGLRLEVLILTVHGLVILRCLWRGAQVRYSSSVSRRGFL